MIHAPFAIFGGLTMAYSFPFRRLAFPCRLLYAPYTPAALVPPLSSSPASCRLSRAKGWKAVDIPPRPVLQ